jgi:hypothetical protein
MAQSASIIDFINNIEEHGSDDMPLFQIDLLLHSDYFHTIQFDITALELQPLFEKRDWIRFRNMFFPLETQSTDGTLPTLYPYSKIKRASSLPDSLSGLITDKDHFSQKRGKELILDKALDECRDTLKKETEFGMSSEDREDFDSALFELNEYKKAMNALVDLMTSVRDVNDLLCTYDVHSDKYDYRVDGEVIEDTAALKIATQPSCIRAKTLACMRSPTPDNCTDEYMAIRKLKKEALHANLNEERCITQ